ncbi:pentatricopeptide repeat-containing protein At5g04780, mitochondrial isoform X1 [Punica granatum]|uniref:Pentatricopeptide repeat-containing protein At5g04780, mitochondrial isoform X1 n=1 Tax=Punica granatum TaxID=22663 RepID=A0A6P8BZ19_PUNGR|nr:pentatricopeptide repeat-containing protein At5g04780, mitochondrial isoform X1 [Punica granatum]XP_031374851.1 pentatricopeptide repeat-containing protein At5g04780, mitochondrial isoform X1 [Punica granatum]
MISSCIHRGKIRAFRLCCPRYLSAVPTAQELDQPLKNSPVPEDGVAAHVQKLNQILQSCARNGDAIEGKACHAQVIHLGLHSDTLTANILVNMYSKCGLLDYARKVFDGMPHRSLVSWNTMIGTLARVGEDQEALTLFIQMLRRGKEGAHAPFSEFTLSSVLCACAAKCALLECKQLHAFSVKAMMDENVFVATALLDLYAKCGLINDANSIFESMRDRSEVTWSSMIAGYVRNEMYEEALVLFQRGQVIGLEHNQFSISAIICACAGLAALIEGNQVHAILWKAGFGSNIFIASSLIDMYAKCGSIREAYIVFLGVEEKNTVLMNSIISGFAKHARPTEAMVLYEKMQQMGMYPNEVTFVCVLNACSHVGSVQKGRKYFDLMIKEYNLSPNVLHYACMVDILGRAGLVNEAYDLIAQMPFDATSSMWGSLLSSCRNHGNLDLAVVAASKLFEIEPENAGNHVLLSNVYAANKKWAEVARVRKFLKDSEAKKEKGRSWIEIKDKVHSFMVGERNHPRIADIYDKLDRMMEEMERMGYRAETEHDLHDVDSGRKQELLKHHSEKLALAFGLMCSSPNAPLRIMKNLRICVDCHSFMKLASSITGREIIVRDTNRFHHFTDGSCSCGDFW